MYMAHCKVNSSWGARPQEYAFFSSFLHIILIHDLKALENIKSQLSVAILCVHLTHKVGCFFKMVKILHFDYFITQLVKTYGKGLYIM